jgi:hypothetical protein
MRQSLLLQQMCMVVIVKYALTHFIEFPCEMYVTCRFYLKEKNKHKTNVILKLFAHLSIKTFLDYNGYSEKWNKILAMEM